MRIKTRFFGEIEIDETNILTFHNGIPGFEDYKRYLVLDIEDNDNLKCLQSVEDASICLMITSPWNYFKDYQIELSDEDIDELKIEREQDVLVYNVLTVRGENVTLNLVAPVVINVINKNGKQIILSNAKYDIRQEIKCL